jgi:HAD superfamily hydrolase (TIGR01662 family)
MHMSTHSFGVLGPLERRLALGLLRLGTEGRPDEADAIALIHRALDPGVRLLDTADTYCLDERDLHYGERLAKGAVDAWDGPREEVRVLTKVGMERPKGKWRPNGRASRIRSSVEGSVAALGGAPIFMLLLHGNDYKTPFEESLAALAALQAEGQILHLGLCNVGIAEIRQAQRHFEVQAVQCELSVVNRKAGTTGVVQLCADLGIPFLAHRPFGGHAKSEKLLKNRAMKPVAARYGITPHEAALATLLHQKPAVIPVVGARRMESLESSLRAMDVRLDAEDQTRVDAKITFRATPEALRDVAPPVTPDGLRPLVAGEGPGDQDEVVIIMGVQGAGKSSMVDGYLARGYERLNRDLLGGKLSDLVPKLDALLAEGKRRVVLDNTYPSKVSRYPVVRTAHRHGVPVRCQHLATPIREAFINIVTRVLDRYDFLPGPDELKELSKTDPNLPPPVVMALWTASFEAPSVDEGFSVVEETPFVRRPGPKGSAKGLLLDVDGTLRITKSGDIYPIDPDDVELLPNRREVLSRYLAEGYQLFFVSNQSGVASDKLTAAQAQACFDRTAQLLDLPITEICFCPHKAFPASCFCRKPAPGFGIYLMRKYGLALEDLIMVGDMGSDEGFADAFGARFVTADAFFA